MVLFILFLLFIEVILFSMFSFSFKFIIDNALLPENGQLLKIILLALVIIGFLEVFIGTIEDYLYANVLAKVLQDIRYKVFNHIQGLSLHYYTTVKTGDILSHFSNDLIVIENTVTNLLFDGIYPTFYLLINLILLFVLDWRLTLIAILFSLLLPLGPKIITPYLVSENDERKDLEADLLSTVQEDISMQKYH